MTLDDALTTVELMASVGATTAGLENAREAIAVVRAELKRLRRIEHAIGRVIRSDDPAAPGDGVWVDLASWEAVEDLMGGREVMYDRYRKMLERDREAT